MKDNKEITLGKLIKALKVNYKIIFILYFFAIILVFVNVHRKNSKALPIYTVYGIIQVDNNVSMLNSNISVAPSGGDANASVGGNLLAANSQIVQTLLGTSYVLKSVIKNHALDFAIIDDTSLVDKVMCKLKSRVKFLGAKCVAHDVQLNVKSFDVDVRLINQSLKFKLRDDKNFSIYRSEHLLLNGVVGKWESENGINLLIESITGSKNAEVIIQKKSIDQVITGLKQSIRIEPMVASRDNAAALTGLLKISMSGGSPELQANIINEMIDELYSLQKEQRNTILKVSIDFINQQLPLAESKVMASRAKMVEYQSKHDVVLIDAQSREYIHSLSTIENNILDNQISLHQYSSLYTKDHPLMQSLLLKESSLEIQKKEIERKLFKIPSHEASYLTLQQELSTNEGLYSFLASKKQDLDIKYASVVVPITVISYATPVVTPDIVKISSKTAVLTAIFVMAFIAVLVLIFIFTTNRDPWLVPDVIGAKLLLIVPFGLKKSRNNFRHAIEFIANYFLLKFSNGSCIINISGVSKKCGKSYLIQQIMKLITDSGKSCIHINFQVSESCLPLIVVNKLFEINKMHLWHIPLRVNGAGALDDIQVRNLLATVRSKYQFVFIECSSEVSKFLFFTISKSADETVLISSPVDKPSELDLLVNDMSNIDGKVDCVIFNNPKGKIIKSANSV